jgi:hypothetical protein
MKWTILEDPKVIEKDMRYKVAIFDSGVYSTAYAAEQDGALHTLPDYLEDRDEVYIFTQTINLIINCLRSSSAAVFSSIEIVIKENPKCQN